MPHATCFGLVSEEGEGEGGLIAREGIEHSQNGLVSEKKKEGLLPVRVLNILKTDSRSAASPATLTW